MKTRLLIIISLAIISLNVSNVLAVCDPEIIKPGELCQDGFSTLIIDPHDARIENIDGKQFHVIGPFTLELELNDRVRLDGVTFTYPSFPNIATPGGPVSVIITFENGAKESIFKVGAPLPFIEFVGVDPQAGVRRNTNGSFDYLLSFEKKFDSPLKQYKDHMPRNEYVCQPTFIPVIKINEKYACVSGDTAPVLIKRGWATCVHQVKIYPEYDCPKGLFTAHHNETPTLSTIEVINGNQTFVVNFNMTNGIINENHFNDKVNELILSIEAFDNGTLRITLPREFMDSKIGSGCPNPKSPDDIFFVLINGSEMSYKEIQTTDISRILEMPFLGNTTEITILGSCML